MILLHILFYRHKFFYGWMKPTSKLGYITNLKKKDTEMCDTEWRSMRGNNEGLNFPLHLAKN
jgi:hypothetical protein